MMWVDRPRSLSWLAGACLLVVLAGCADDEPADPQLDLGGSKGSAPSASASADGKSTSSPDVGIPEVSAAPEKGDTVPDEDSGVWALQLPEKSSARQVAQAFVDYMEVRAEAFRTGEIDLTQLSSVAMEDALTGVQAGVADLKQKGLHTVGGAWILVEDDDVDITGERANLSDFCFRNGSVDVNQGNIAQESPPDAYAVDATAVRVAKATWLISAVSFEEVSSC